MYERADLEEYVAFPDQLPISTILGPYSFPSNRNIVNFSPYPSIFYFLHIFQIMTYKLI